MSKHNGRKKQKVRIELIVGILGAIATIIAALIPVIRSSLDSLIENILVTPTPKPLCISADDILVTFHILKNNEVIAELAPSETVFLYPDLRVYFKLEIKSVTNNTLPELECKWTNTDIDIKGRLLHNVGCSMVDYQTGHTTINDVVAVQLSQPSCPALAPYPFFIMSNP